MAEISHPRLSVAVVGSGISGLSAAWLLGQAHDVTLYEGDNRLGGHSNTIDARLPQGEMPVDTGFIVYNETTYPNLAALFDYLGVQTQASDMSFAVSLEDGRFEYSGRRAAGLFAQKANLARPRFWTMLNDLVRFYRAAPADPLRNDPDLTLGAYLDMRGYSRAFIDDHLLPMAGAIWSAPAGTLRDYPFAAFLRFQENHGLLKLRQRPVWRTVAGGSRGYVERLRAAFTGTIRLGATVTRIQRLGDGVLVRDVRGARRFDHVVVATHADQALALLEEPTLGERDLLGAFRYSLNRAVLHTDIALMPRRRAAWASWNYIGSCEQPADRPVTVTYWMNRLQALPTERPVLVTLNPQREPGPDTALYETSYEHPIFDPAAMAAQRQLWSLQGHGGVWYCGAHFGAGFHEDGLQSGLAVAEALGGVRRPWSVAEESGRIVLGPTVVAEPARAA